MIQSIDSDRIPLAHSIISHFFAGFVDWWTRCSILRRFRYNENDAYWAWISRFQLSWTTSYSVLLTTSPANTEKITLKCHTESHIEIYFISNNSTLTSPLQQLHWTPTRGPCNSDHLKPARGHLCWTSTSCTVLVQLAAYRTAGRTAQSRTLEIRLEKQPWRYSAALERPSSWIDDTVRNSRWHTHCHSTVRKGSCPRNRTQIKTDMLLKTI